MCNLRSLTLRRNTLKTLTVGGRARGAPLARGHCSRRRARSSGGHADRTSLDESGHPESGVQPRSVLSELRSLRSLDLSSNDVRDSLEFGLMRPHSRDPRNSSCCGDSAVGVGGGGGGGGGGGHGNGDGGSACIAAMPELRSLNLCGVASHNRLGPEPPLELWAHRELRQLNLSYCGIEVLPEAIGELARLEDLRCDGNR
jgi:hypothetical protein